MKVLVYRIGQLGDTIIALPALWAIRNHFRNDRITLLCDRRPRTNHVLASDLLSGTGLFEDLLTYDVDSSRVNKVAGLLRLLWLIRRRRFDVLVYLAPADRLPNQVQRDLRFFRFAGIRQVIGAVGFHEPQQKAPNGFLQMEASEVELLLRRLTESGIKVPGPGMAKLDLRLGAVDESEFLQWRDRKPSDSGKRWIGVGPGSKMPSKRWPVERFAAVIRSLIERHDVWPVVFGGGEDREIAEHLLREWGRGYNAAGALSMRAACVALGNCRLFLGNDTGTMHLAAAAGTPCVAVFSSRDVPGRWYPYGVKYWAFRTPIECEGCFLVECLARKNECINRIEPVGVLAACDAALTASRAGESAAHPQAASNFK
jgi:ADP-heptose:LPS heptosyltransferase